ncbi:delta-lactam-biosynthetic de-N-acetylase [Clostridium ganghwense]|uniref:Delta-lactam-biosynthetic de-N-acetylase n=1 Tax=Clostridium ganghwense TaxID=312089 RepID=A0ABT4CWJ1_9CLOT|nr:delta-lactam-biosynthetic de-N-acetylase [Clostridium ganghwense]MCY6372566.1 delta-lactam-biosynthetic de-N-acetylase [Clostridium ganghwense]
MKNKCLISLLSLTLAFSLMGCSSEVQQPENSKKNTITQSKPENESTMSKSKAVINEKVVQASKNPETKQIITDEKSEPKKEVKKESEIIEDEKKEIDDMNKFNLKDREWFFMPNKKGLQPEEPQEVLDIIKDRDAYYVGKADEKVLYLTFDEGYENGYSSKILDVLKKNNVKAAFFVTEPYIKENKDLVKRMVEEGHIVCNHSKNHTSMAKLAKSNKSKFDNEILSTEKTFEEVTGSKMAKFFRPPMGAYNELSLHYTQQLGYKTIFWSSAYRDYEPEDQPSQEYAKNLILQRTHNGSIILLHAISKTNTEILDYLIHEWKDRGYNFRMLTELD